MMVCIIHYVAPFSRTINAPNHVHLVIPCGALWNNSRIPRREALADHPVEGIDAPFSTEVEPPLPLPRTSFQPLNPALQFLNMLSHRLWRPCPSCREQKVSFLSARNLQRISPCFDVVGGRASTLQNVGHITRRTADQPAKSASAELSLSE